MNFDEWFAQLKISVKGIYHYRKSALLVTWIVALIGFAVVSALPERYEAKARIYVDNESVLNPLLKNITVRLDKSDRIKQLSRTLLSRPNLEQIANKSDLDLSVYNYEQKEQLIKNLSSEIKLSREAGTNLFSIRYTNSDPQLAKGVVGTVVNLFIESILSESRLDTKSAQKFLSSQIEQYEEKLQIAEQALALFKRKHIGVLPNDGGSYYQNLQAILREIEDAKIRQEALRRQKKELVSSLKSKNTIDLEGFSLVNPLEKKYQLLISQKQELKSRYTDLHPLVRQLDTELKQVQRDLDEGMSLEFLDDNPIVQQINILLASVGSELAAQTATIEALDNKRFKLEETVSSIIEIEAQLADLNRDYLINKQNYQKLLERREAAKIAQDVDADASSVQFRIVDPPFAPAHPTSPKRGLLLSAVLLASIVVGVAFAYARSLVSRVFFDSKHFEQSFGIEVFQNLGHGPLAYGLSLRKGALSFMTLIALLGVYLILYLV